MTDKEIGPLDSEGKRLWDRVKETIDPLLGKEKIPEKSKNISTKRIVVDPVIREETTSDIKEKTSLPDLVMGKTAGVDKALAKRIKKGDQAIEARLDLHGKTQEEAHKMLNHFIPSCYHQGKRNVLIITGKGNPERGTGVLRTQVPRWLDLPHLRQHVVMVCPASPKDGGEGALYLLLKK